VHGRDHVGPTAIVKSRFEQDLSRWQAALTVGTADKLVRVSGWRPRGLLLGVGLRMT
jgi:hypothetical protein